MNAETSFRLNTRTVYLTYPQCPIEMQDMLNKLKEIKEYTYYAICKEQHQDGSPHLHVMLRYAEPINTRNPRYYDIENYHPNVQSARKPKDVLKYILKDGNYMENWPTKRGYGEILEASKDYEEFMNLMKENQPKDYILHHDKLEYFSDKFFKRPPSPYQEIPNNEPWRLPEDITNWLSGEFTKTGTNN